MSGVIRPTLRSHGLASPHARLRSIEARSPHRALFSHRDLAQSEPAPSRQVRATARLVAKDAQAHPAESGPSQKRQYDPKAPLCLPPPPAPTASQKARADGPQEPLSPLACGQPARDGARRHRVTRRGCGQNPCPNPAVGRAPPPQSAGQGQTRPPALTVGSAPFPMAPRLSFAISGSDQMEAGP